MEHSEYLTKKDQEHAYYAFIGEQIRKQRESLNMTQDGLARRIGISRIAVVNIELGKQRLALHNVMEVCVVLGISVDLLLNINHVILSNVHSSLQLIIKRETDIAAKKIHSSLFDAMSNGIISAVTSYDHELKTRDNEK